MSSVSSGYEVVTFDKNGDVVLLLGGSVYRPDRGGGPSLGHSNDGITATEAPIGDTRIDAILVADPFDTASVDEAHTPEAHAAEDPAGKALENQAELLESHAEVDALISGSEASHFAKTSEQKFAARVSSKHLALASTFFDDMFQDLAKDAPALNDRNLPTVYGDPAAWQILLYVIHGRTKRVPRYVEKNELVQILDVIDKYEFGEAVEVFTDIWFEALRPSIPRHLDQDLASWIQICWQLDKLEELDALTRIAIWEIDCGLDDPAGRVPFWIIDKVQSHRHSILTEFAASLSELLEAYIGSHRQCLQDNNCDPLLFGKFAKGLKKAELYPIPEPSSLKMSVEALFSIVRKLDVSPSCGEKGKKYRRNTFSEDSDEQLDSRHLGEKVQDALFSIRDRFERAIIDDRSKKDGTRK